MAKKRNCTARAKNTTAVERWNNEGCRGSTLLGHEFTPGLLSLTHTHRLYVCLSLFFRKRFNCRLQIQSHRPLVQDYTVIDEKNINLRQHPHHTPRRGTARGWSLCAR